MPYKRQVVIPVTYKTLTVECGCRADLIVSDKVAVELKATGEILPVHKAQLMAYMKLTGIRVGLLLNFSVPVMKDGVTRLVL